ncbi:MAG: hypothetical protein IPF99_02170 [Deltaproteobacteria bacterium]|nr:hypothetical protein [Deltaproteobacteria bacterium]
MALAPATTGICAVMVTPAALVRSTVAVLALAFTTSASSTGVPSRSGTVTR